MSCWEHFKSLCVKCCQLPKPDKSGDVASPQGDRSKPPEESVDKYVMIDLVPLRKTATDDHVSTTPDVPHQTCMASEAAVGHERRGLLRKAATIDTLGSCSPSSPIPVQQVIPAKAAKMFSTLHFTLYHDFQRSILFVNLLKATNLAARRGSKSKTGIFVVLHLHPSKEEVFESNLASNLVTPQFNQLFEFKLTVEEASHESIVFRLYEGTSSTSYKGKFIGSLAVPLKEVEMFGATMVMVIDESGHNLPGATNSKGDLLLSLMYNPEEHLLQGTVMKMTALPDQVMIDSADLYVKLYLVHSGVRQAKWKTSVKKNTLTPVFNESFRFDVSQMDMPEFSLEAVVIDYDRFSRNHLVGSAFIGEGVSTELGRSHWAEMISSPHTAISHWHSILPASSHHPSRQSRSRSRSPGPAHF